MALSGNWRRKARRNFQFSSRSRPLLMMCWWWWQSFVSYYIRLFSTRPSIPCHWDVDERQSRRSVVDTYCVFVVVIRRSPTVPRMIPAMMLIHRSIQGCWVALLGRTRTASCHTLTTVAACSPSTDSFITIGRRSPSDTILDYYEHFTALHWWGSR